MKRNTSDQLVMKLTFWLCFAIGVLAALAIGQILWQGEIPSFRMVMIVVAMAVMCWLTKRALKKGDRR